MLGEKIKAYRESKKMTQKDIAEILEVEPGTISKYESGMIEPNIESIKRLAETFGITIDELLKNEVRYNSLAKKDPEGAKIALELNKQDAIKRYNYYKELTNKKSE